MNYRLVIFPAIETGDFSVRFLFETKQELNAAKHTCIGLLLFMQDQAQVMNDFSNCFCCEEKVGNDWEDIDD